MLVNHWFMLLQRFEQQILLVSVSLVLFLIQPHGIQIKLQPKWTIGDQSHSGDSLWPYKLESDIGEGT